MLSHRKQWSQGSEHHRLDSDRHLWGWSSVCNDFPFSGFQLFVLNGIHLSPSEPSQWAKIDSGQFTLAVSFVSRILAWTVSDQRRFPTSGVVGTATSAGTWRMTEGDPEREAPQHAPGDAEGNCLAFWHSFRCSWGCSHPALSSKRDPASFPTYC